MRVRRKLRRGDFRGLTATAVEKVLGPAPKHVYDYGMQAAWVKAARQWVYEQRLPEAIYPVHGWSLGWGGARSPYTWFRCQHGHMELGSPHQLPERDCFVCAFAWPPQPDLAPTEWQVANYTQARASTIKALDDKPDLIRQHDEPVQ